VVRAAYFDCFSGASGDMLLGALVDAGAPLDGIRAGLAGLPVAGWRLDAEPASQHGLRGTRARVTVDHSDAPTRGLTDVEAILAAGRLPERVLDQARSVFRRLARVEAGIHGTTVDQVHFHEVGAVDAIVDVVGVCVALDLLGVEAIHCSGLPTGSGWTGSAHGPLPVPAPATLELLRLAGAPTRRAPGDAATGGPSMETGELTTPTGAALLTTLASFTNPPFRGVERVGYGFGSRILPWPNGLRVTIGQVDADGVARDRVVEIETNLDDSTPEELGFAMERLLAAGALDVAFGPLQMKKNRPGVLVRVLGRPGDLQALAEALLLHTSALGVRYRELERLVAERAEATAETPWGPVRLKIKQVGQRRLAAPEYEDCARLARAAGVPLRAVYDAARAAFGA
jgi:pyridinium-3,5-bisthiocarboxylic acid mononucleotide nickel chelatase